MNSQWPGGQVEAEKRASQLATPMLAWSRPQRNCGSVGHKGFQSSPWGAYSPAGVLTSGSWKQRSSSELQEKASHQRTGIQVTGSGIVQESPQGTGRCAGWGWPRAGGWAQDSAGEGWAQIERGGALGRSIKKQGMPPGFLCVTHPLCPLFTIGTHLSLR